MKLAVFAPIFVSSTFLILCGQSGFAMAGEMNQAQPHSSVIQCGNKFDQTKVSYVTGADEKVLISHTTFSRGPLYTSQSDGSVSSNRNVYFVVGSDREEHNVELNSSVVREIPGGIEVTFANPRRSVLTIAKVQNQLRFFSTNTELLQSVTNGANALDCGD